MPDKKIPGFQRRLREEKIDVVLLFNNESIDSSMLYFTGTKISNSFLFIPKKGKAKLFVFSLEYENARKSSKIKSIGLFNNKKSYESAFRKYLRNKNAGINCNFVSVNSSKKIRSIGKPKKLKDVSYMLADARECKTKEEERILQKACDISKKVFERTIRNFRRFRTEIDVRDFMESEMKKFNVVPSFPIIVASGKNASMPHHEPSKSKLNNGFCIIDFGVNYQGYCSDITRTIYIGKPGEKEKEKYYLLLGVQEEAIRKLKKGVDYWKIHDSVQKILGKKFIHGLGHGLGIDVHEALGTSKGKKLILKEGNYLTVEPGIYERGKFGIRIEDDVLVTKKGAVVFSKIRKELIVIK